MRTDSCGTLAKRTSLGMPPLGKLKKPSFLVLEIVLDSRFEEQDRSGQDRGSERQSNVGLLQIKTNSSNL